MTFKPATINSVFPGYWNENDDELNTEAVPASSSSVVNCENKSKNIDNNNR